MSPTAVWLGAAPCPPWASVCSSGLYHRGLGQAVTVPPPHPLQEPAVLAGAEPREPLGWKGAGGGRGAWGLSQLDSPLILSKDASPQGGGRLGPDIKGPPPLALSRAPCKVTGSRRMTLSPGPKLRLGERKRRTPGSPLRGLWLNPARPSLMPQSALSPRAGLRAASLGDVVRAWPWAWASPHGQGTRPLGPLPPSLQGAPELGAHGDTE